MPASAYLSEPERRVPIYGEYDVVVLGGGPAGIAAAAASGALGRRTLLVERYGFLGGMGTPMCMATSGRLCMASRTISLLVLPNSAA